MIKQLIFRLLQIFFVCTAVQITAQNSEEEYGLASFYSDKLHGRKTASGEMYDKTKLTCAHRNYDFGTYLRITRLDTKSSVLVKVNDRGPFVKGMLVDLSREAADALGMLGDGKVRVKVERATESEAVKKHEPEAVKPEERNTEPTPVKEETAKTEKVEKKEEKVQEVDLSEEKEEPIATTKNSKNKKIFKIELRIPDSKGFVVQVVSFTNESSLFTEIAKLQGTWEGEIMIELDENSKGETIYKLLLGPFDSEKTAKKEKQNAVKKGYKSAFVLKMEK